MLDSRHLMVKLLHSGVVLAKQLSLLDHRKVQRLITDLVTVPEVSPHQVGSGETTKGHGNVNLHARKQDALAHVSSRS